MTVKYINLYNHQTEHISDYVLISEDKHNFHCILPVTYYWLKTLEKTEWAPLLTTAYDKIMFELHSYNDTLERMQVRYSQRYGYYYKNLVTTEDQLKKMDEVGRFIEHFAHQSKQVDIIKRIENGITGYSYYLNDTDYKKALGPIISQLLNTEEAEQEAAKYKALFSDKMQPFLDYIS